MRITAGVAALYLLMTVAASLTGSMRGEAGLAICVLVVVAALGVERALHGTSPSAAFDLLGLVRRPGRALLVVCVVALPLVAFYPVLRLLFGDAVVLRAGWVLTAIGVFLQGGIAEEVIWRGYLYRHLREGRTVRAAMLGTMIIMVAAHVPLVWSLDPVSALAALIVSAVIVFPMCRVFDLDQGAIWSVALLHAVVQGMPKLFDVSPELASLAIMGWALMSTAVPLAVFAFRVPPETRYSA